MFRVNSAYGPEAAVKGELHCQLRPLQCVNCKLHTVLLDLIFNLPKISVFIYYSPQLFPLKKINDAKTLNEGRLDSNTDRDVSNCSRDILSSICSTDHRRHSRPFLAIKSVDSIFLRNLIFFN